MDEKVSTSSGRGGAAVLNLGSLLVAALFLWLTINVVVSPKFSSTRWSQVWTAVAAIGGLALLVGAVVSSRGLVARLESRRWVRRAIVSAFVVLVFAMQVRVGYAIRFDPGWDAGTMEFFTKGVVDGSLTVRSVSDAYSQYPNNLFLASLMIWLWRAWFGAGLADTDLALVLVNASVLTAAILVTYLSARRVGRPAVAYVVLGLSLVLIGFSPWLGVVYSDTVGMLPIALLGYLICLLATVRSVWARAAIWAGVGAVGAIGYQIKPTVVFVVIAAVLVGLLTTRWRTWTRQTIRARVAGTLALALGALAAGQACDQLVERTDMTTAPERRILALPLAHFLMMGASEKPGLHNNFYGAYRDEDYAATSSFPPGPERSEFAFGEWRKRVAAMGPVGYARFLNNKATWTFGDGTFFVYGEGGMSPDPMPFPNTSETDRRIQSFMNLRGDHFWLTVNVWQSVWLLVLLLMAAPLVLRRDRDLMSPPAATMRAAVLGLAMFILLFEGRSRYVYLYLPFFLLLASLGVAALAERLRPTSASVPEVVEAEATPDRASPVPEASSSR